MRAAALHPVGRVPSKPFAMADLFKRANALTGIPTAQLKSRCRAKPLVKARFAIMYVARRRKPNATYPWLAMQLGVSNHTSIIYGISQAHVLIEKDREFKAFVDALEQPFALENAA